MDKLTVFDILAFLIPGAVFNGLAYYFLLINQVDLSIFHAEKEPILSSISFLGLSYIIGFIVSEFAFHLFNKFLSKSDKFNHARIITDEFDTNYLLQLSKYNQEYYAINIMDKEGNKPVDIKIKESFLIWVETIAMHTKYGLCTVLHGQYMLFRNLSIVFLTSMLFLIATLIHFLNASIYLRTDFILVSLFCLALIPISYKIFASRFKSYTKVTVRAIYSYFANLNYHSKTKNND